MVQDIWNNEPYQMILKGKGVYDGLVLQAWLEVPFQGQTVLELRVNPLVQLTLLGCYSPLERLQS